MQFLPGRRLPRSAAFAIASLLPVALATSIAVAGTAGDIVVVAVHGETTSTMAGVTTPLYPNAVLQLPTTIRTGHDGAIELRQGKTTIAAAADTELEIPASAAQEGLIERVVQIRGNAFYNVAKRERTRLRVETPYLVAVVKGTQFNVAALPDSTTIALFEGRLDVLAADGSDVVDLHAGEIAIRNRSDVSIQTLDMRAATARSNTAVGRSNGDSAAPATNAALDSGNVAASVSDSTDGVGTEATAGTSATASPEAASVTAGTGAAVDIGSDSAPVAAAVADPGGSSAVVDSNANVDLGGSSAVVDTGASVDLGGGSGVVDAGASVDTGIIGADVAADASPSGTSLDVGADASVDLGSVSAGNGANVSIDVDQGNANVDINVSAGPGGAEVDIDVGVGASASNGANVFVDVGTEVGGVDADVGVGNNGADVDVNVSQGVNAGAEVNVGGGVDIDLNVGNANVGLGLGSETSESETDSKGNSGGSLNGLLNRRP